MARVSEAAASRLGWVSPRLVEWYGLETLERQLEAGLAVEVERIGDAAFGTDYRDAVGVPVDDPLDWANRRVVLPDGGWMVTGIRFRGREVSRPFVDLVATTASPTPDGLLSLAPAVEAAYGEFGPLCVRVEVSDPAALVAEVESDPRFGAGSAVDMYRVAGRVAELRAAPRAPSYDAVTLRPGEPDRLAALVSESYRVLGEARPQLAMWASPEDEESLAECAAEGLLLEVVHRGESAGVVAALRDDAHGMTGFGVQEIVLRPTHGGQGVAPGVLQRLVDELPAAPGDVLWGSIHPDNTPSLRNALSIGREIVGGHAWITLPGMTGMPTSTRG